MAEVQDPLEEIINVLDDQCEEEVIELSKGHEIMAKVVEKDAVADILQFGSHSSDTMEKMLERIEFFKVQSQVSEQQVD